jgi:hypothetical protein
MLQCGLFRSNFALPIAAASYEKEELLHSRLNPWSG